MKPLFILTLLILACAGCTTSTVNVPPGFTGTIVINQSKTGTLPVGDSAIRAGVGALTGGGASGAANGAAVLLARDLRPAADRGAVPADGDRRPRRVHQTRLGPVGALWGPSHNKQWFNPNRP